MSRVPKEPGGQTQQGPSHADSRSQLLLFPLLWHFLSDGYKIIPLSRYLSCSWESRWASRGHRVFSQLFPFTFCDSPSRHTLLSLLPPAPLRISFLICQDFPQFSVPDPPDSVRRQVCAHENMVRPSTALRTAAFLILSVLAGSRGTFSVACAWSGWNRRSP